MIKIGEPVKTYFLTFLVFLVCISAPAFAQVTVTAKISPTLITVDEEAIITVTVTGQQSTSDPVAPRVAGLSVVLTGRSSQINIFNSQVQAAADYLFTVVPSDPGEYNIPPFVVFSSGVEYRSAPLHLSVKPGGSYTSKPNPSSPFYNSPNPNYQFPSQQNQPDPAPSGENFWISTSVSNTNPYLYQEILFSFKLFTRVNLDFEDLKIPAFRDFRVEELVPEKKGRQTVGGRSYSTYEIVYALYPLKPGKRLIEETKAKVKYFVQNRQNPNSFFFGLSAKPQIKTVLAKAIEIEVMDLPEPKPQDFTGLVGHFDLNAELSDHHLNVGDSATLAVTLSGVGNIRDAKLPEFDLKGFKIYANKPVEQIDKTQNGVRGSKAFSLALMPEAAGEINLGTLGLSYFDPESGAYTRLKFPDLVLVAKAGVAPDSPALMASHRDSDPSQVLVRDLAPLVSDPNRALQGSAIPLISERLAKLVFLVLLVLFGFWQLASWIKVAFFKPTKRGRVRKSWRCLAKLLDHSSVSDRELWESLKDFFVTLMDLKTGSVTALDMHQYCLTHLPQNVVKDFEAADRLLAKVESSLYGFMGEGLTRTERQLLKQWLQNLL